MNQLPRERRTLRCARCDKMLHPGRGQFYVVRIDAVCDPTPPSFTEEELARDFDRELERLNREVETKSETELEEQVFCRKFLCLCTPCYRPWIEDPVD